MKGDAPRSKRWQKFDIGLHPGSPAFDEDAENFRHLWQVHGDASVISLMLQEFPGEAIREGCNEEIGNWLFEALVELAHHAENNPVKRGKRSLAHRKEQRELKLERWNAVCLMQESDQTLEYCFEHAGPEYLGSDHRYESVRKDFRAVEKALAEVGSLRFAKYLL